MNKEELKKLNELYNKFESEKPPQVLSRDEAIYNKGLYKGTLKAMEFVVEELTGKNGDELKLLLEDPQ